MRAAQACRLFPQVPFDPAPRPGHEAKPQQALATTIEGHEIQEVRLTHLDAPGNHWGNLWETQQGIEPV